MSVIYSLTHTDYKDWLICDVSHIHQATAGSENWLAVVPAEPQRAYKQFVTILWPAPRHTGLMKCKH